MSYYLTKIKYSIIKKGVVKMANKQAGLRLLLTLVIAFSMTMPATIIVGAGDNFTNETDYSNLETEKEAAVHIGGNIYKVWIEGDVHDTKIMFTYSFDDGITWKMPSRITPDEFVPLTVQLSASAGTLHLVWMDAVSRHLRTAYMSFDIARNDWTTPVIFEGENPNLTSQGDVVVIATRHRSCLTLYVSGNNGQSFYDISPMDEIKCLYPSVLFDNGILHLAAIGHAEDTGVDGIYYTYTRDFVVWKAPSLVVRADNWMKEISLTSNNNQLSIQWREVSIDFIRYYSVEETVPGTFGGKTLISCEPVERENYPLREETPKSRLPPKKWTFIVYLDADNNLDGAGYADMTEMEAIGSNFDLNIIVLFDGRTVAGPDSHCYYIEPGSRTEIPLTLINSSWTTGELNMGDPQTAIDFANYVFVEYPADKYLWDMWNHGGSWNWAMCEDETDGDHLTSLEVRSIYETLRVDTGKIKLFDVAGYDECLMSDASVYYDEMPYIDYMCNSEDSIGFDGWEYDIVLGYMNSNLDMDGEEAAFWVFQAYVDAYGTSDPLTTMSVINAEMLATSLAPAINNLAQKGIHEITAHRANLRAAANGAQSWQGYFHQRDLYHFCELAIASILTGEVHDALQDVLDAAAPNPVGTTITDPFWESNKAILIHNQNTNEHGMKIYVADDPYNSVYDTMTITDTNWDEFYKVLWGSDADNPNIEPTVGIMNPMDGSTITKDSMVTITGNAADADGGVTRVDVGLHTQHWTPAFGTSSWSYLWDTTGWDTGWYKIMARSYDGQDFSDVDIHNVLMVDNLPPTVTLQDNNGQAEDGTWTTTEQITWIASDPDGDDATLDIKAEYSPNAGGSWFTIEDGVGNNDGLCLWDTSTVADGSNYLLKVTVTDEANVSVSDESDAVFTINNLPSITISTPDGGEIWMGGSSQTIWWDMSDSYGNLNDLTVDIYYSTDSGATYPNTIVTGLTGFSSNPCSYEWNPLPVIDSNTVKVKTVVTDPFPRTSEDTSQSDFTIDSTAPSPATNVRAELTGANDVTIYWDESPSPDAGHYEVWQIQNGWDPTGDTYTFLGTIPAGTTEYVHVNRGASNQNSYAYQVRSFDIAGNEVRTLIQAAKLSRTLPISQNDWWLLGSYLVQSDTSLGHVIQGQGFPAYWDYAMAWDAGNQKWISYVEGRPPFFNDLTDISNEMGFWLHTTGNARFATTGYVSDMNINLYAGWNLVTYPYAERMKTTAQIETDLIANCPNYVPGSMSIFDSGQPYGIKAPIGTEQILSEEGFWIQVTTDTNWFVANY
jgi:hypothetical protein